MECFEFEYLNSSLPAYDVIMAADQSAASLQLTESQLEIQLQFQQESAHVAKWVESS